MSARSRRNTAVLIALLLALAAGGSLVYNRPASTPAAPAPAAAASAPTQIIMAATNEQSGNAPDLSGAKDETTPPPFKVGKPRHVDESPVVAQGGGKGNDEAVLGARASDADGAAGGTTGTVVAAADVVSTNTEPTGAGNKAGPVSIISSPELGGGGGAGGGGQVLASYTPSGTGDPVLRAQPENVTPPPVPPVPEIPEPANAILMLLGLALLFATASRKLAHGHK